MKHSIILALLGATVAVAQPSSPLLDYRLLCGEGTTGSGDNDDFCQLWATGNYRGMRNALSVAIRQGRAQENRNRFYFDHKRGSERGAFIQLKRPWMGEDWRVLQHVHGHGGVAWISGSEAFLTIEFSKDLLPGSGFDVGDIGFASIGMYGGISSRYEFEFERRHETGPTRPLPADFVRRMVECKIDEFGYSMGVADERRDCENITVGNDYDGGRPTTRRKLPTPIFSQHWSGGLGWSTSCDTTHGVWLEVPDPRNGADWYELEVTQVDPDISDWHQVTERDFDASCARGEPCSCDRGASGRRRCDSNADADVTPETILNGHWRLRIRYLAIDWETSEWSNAVYHDYSDNGCGD